MINLEFASTDEIDEALTIVRNSIDEAIRNDEKSVEFEFQGKTYKINLQSNAFNIGMLYGLSMARDGNKYL